MLSAVLWLLIAFFLNTGLNASSYGSPGKSAQKKGIKEIALVNYDFQDDPACWDPIRTPVSFEEVIDLFGQARNHGHPNLSPNDFKLSLIGRIFDVLMLQEQMNHWFVGPFNFLALLFEMGHEDIFLPEQQRKVQQIPRNKELKSIIRESGNKEYHQKLLNDSLFEIETLQGAVGYNPSNTQDSQNAVKKKKYAYIDFISEDPDSTLDSTKLKNQEKEKEKQYDLNSFLEIATMLRLIYANRQDLTVDEITDFFRQWFLLEKKMTRLPFYITPATLKNQGDFITYRNDGSDEIFWDVKQATLSSSVLPKDQRDKWEKMTLEDKLQAVADHIVAKSNARLKENFTFSGTKTTLNRILINVSYIAPKDFEFFKQQVYKGVKQRILKSFSDEEIKTVIKFVCYHQEELLGILDDHQWGAYGENLSKIKPMTLDFNQQKQVTLRYFLKYDPIDSQRHYLPYSPDNLKKRLEEVYDQKGEQRMWSFFFGFNFSDEHGCTFEKIHLESEDSLDLMKKFLSNGYARYSDPMFRELLSIYGNPRKKLSGSASVQLNI